MTKKEAKKNVRTIRKTASASSTERLNSILIENFTGLQKAVTNLTAKFDNLADNMSKLLQLFEISARSFSEKLSTTVPEIEKDREFLDKLNRLLEQNKVIAKGLTLMEERIRERMYGSSQQPIQRPMPQQFRPFQPQGYLPSQFESASQPDRQVSIISKEMEENQ